MQSGAATAAAAAQLPARQLRQQRHALELGDVGQHTQLLPRRGLQGACTVGS